MRDLDNLEIFGEIDKSDMRDILLNFAQQYHDASRLAGEFALPDSFATAKNIVISGMGGSAVGGDLFDVWEIEEGLFGAFIGDVTGHGLPAAFIGSLTKMALAYGKKLKKPDELLTEMNEDTADHMPEGRFVTAAAAVIPVALAALVLPTPPLPANKIIRKLST